MLDFIRVTGSRSRSVFFALFVGFSAISIYAVNAAFSRTDSIRLSPVQVTVTPETALPADVKDLEVQSLGLGFDRDTHTEYVAYGQSRLEVTLDKATEIHTLKVFGPAPYDISVKALVNGQWQDVDGLIDLDLSSLTPFWHSFSVTSAVTTNQLQINIKSSTGGSATGLKELELWGQAERVTVNTGANLLDTIQTDNAAPQARFYSASQSEAIIGNVENLDDETSDNSFSVQLDRDPRTIKRAWLTYESHAAGHWVSVVRDVNGLGDLGGSYRFASSAWSGQLEQINPHWLVQGSNTVSFKVIDDNSYRIRNLGLLIETDDGSNYIETDSITAFPVSDSNTALAAHDGNNLSGWAPYDGAAPRTQRYLQLDFDKQVQLDGLAINLNNSLKGKIEVEFLENGEWQNAGIGAILGQNLVEGWNTIAVDRKVFIDGMKLVFENGNGSKAEIIEVAPVGSGVGATQSPARIDVTYPDAGQYHGDAAYIRGFVQPMDNGSGTAQVFVAGREVTRSDAAFETLVNKTDFTVESTGYSVTVDALYPDGTKVTKKVYLNNGLDAANDLMQTYASDGEIDSNTESLADDNPGTRHNPQDCYYIEHDESALNICKAALEENESPSDIKISSLKQDDLPALNPGMTNVTRGPRRGYRFNPHGKKFRTDVDVIVPFDESRIPAGLTEQDIRTWYFDDELGRWVALEKIEVDKKDKKVKSKTDHFTDMINATLTVPENPEAASFNPTQIKDIKAADPGAGINLIEPPQANNNGSANLSYPIEIPAGRNGMQPQLGVQYNSSGGNGWLGLGWDLSVPSITVETRWGVPRYSTTKETESYLLNGQQMTPLVHRLDQGNLPLRESDKDDFRLRVEGSFQKIKRHGSNPSAYYWEVVDKNGTRNFYGGTESGRSASSVLAGSKGIFKWLLQQSIDTNGNTVNYEYELICDTGIGVNGNNENHDDSCNGGVAGYQQYLKAIHYTGNTSSDPVGPYSITFERDRELNEDRRKDVMIDARGGFKIVTAELLRKIYIHYNNDLVRSYELTYEDGAFSKKRLTALIQKGSNGETDEFNHHEFSYYDELPTENSNLDIFTSKQTVTTTNDEISSQLFTGKIFNQTFIGGTFGYNYGYNGSFGITGPFLGTLASGNAKHSANSSSSEGKISLMDINGDGKPDKVFHQGGYVKYRKNITSPGDEVVRFSNTVYDIPSLRKMIQTTSDSSTTGFNGYAFGGTAFRQKITTTSTDKSFFADVNGDGLVDHVDNGRVLFNYMTNSALPTTEVSFNIDSEATDNPIDGGAMSSTGIFDGFGVTEDELKAQNPLMDAVRRWVAPYTGTIRVAGTVQLHNFFEDETLKEYERNIRQNYETDDGVVIAIQKNNREYWRAKIGPRNDTVYHYHELENITPDGALSLSSINVNKGDKLYFRVMSLDDGSYDRVNWSPKITYVNEPAFHDVNIRNVYEYISSEDMIYAGQPMTVPAAYNGTIHFTGTFKKGITTDDVTFKLDIYEYNEDTDTLSDTPKTGPGGSYSKIIAWDDDQATPIEFDIQVEKDDKIVISYKIDSPIALTELGWTVKPRMYYTQATQPEITLLQPPESDTSDTPPEDIELPEDNSDIGDIDLGDYSPPEDGDPTIPEREVPTFEDGEYLIQLPVNYNMDIYTANNLNGTVQQPWVGRAGSDGKLLIIPTLAVRSKQQICESENDNRGFFGSIIYICTDIPETPDGEIVFTAKRRGELLYKQIIKVENEQVVQSTIGFNALTIQDVSAKDELFFDFTTRDQLLASRIIGSRVHVEYGSDTAWKVPFTDSTRINVDSVIRDTRDNDGSLTIGSTTALILIRDQDNVTVDSRVVTIPAGSSKRFIENFDVDVVENTHLYFDIFSLNDYISIYENDTRIWTRYPGAEDWNVPYTGKIAVEPKLTFKNSATPNGNLILKAYRNNQFVGERNYNVTEGVLTPANESVFNPFPVSFEVNESDKLRVEFWTHSHTMSSLLDNKGEISVDYVDSEAWPVPDIDSDEDTNLDVSISVTPSLNFDFQNQKPDAEISFNIKRNNTVLISEVFKVQNGRLIEPSLPIDLTVKENDVLYFEFTTQGELLLAYLTSSSVQVTLNQNTYTPKSVFNALDIIKPVNALHILMPRKLQNLPVETSAHHYPYVENLFGETYRGWGQAAYLGDGVLANQRIDQNKLLLPETEAAINTFDTEAYPAYPSYEEGRWNSVDGAWHVSDNYLQSTRRGLKYIDLPDASEYERDDSQKRTAGIVRVPRFGLSDGYSDGGGYILTYSNTRTTTNGQLDLMDLNGDRYPDILTSGNVQYTLPDGRMGELKGHRATRKNSTDDNSLSFGGGTEPPTGPSGRFGIPPKSTTNPSNISIGGSMGTGDSDGKIDYFDMNGDGLVDKVTLSGNTIAVAINLGYSFADPETWFKINNNDANVSINGGTSKTFGFNVGWSMPGTTFSGGINLNLGINDVSHRLMDMNGDGLTDFVFASGDYLKVALNLGGKFATPVNWGKPLQTLSDIKPLGNYGGIGIPVGSHTTLSDGLSTSMTISGNGTSGFTIWVAPPPVPILDIVTAGGGNYGETVSQPTVGFNDVNGDGFIDSIRSDNNTKLEVSLSQIGRTNLLKTVARPQGAAFTLEYERVGNTYELPQSMWVMTQVVAFDGAGSDTPDNDSSLGSDFKVFTYDYQNGNHDRFEREFLGFEKIIQNELNTKGIHAGQTETLDTLFDRDRILSMTKVSGNPDGDDAPPFRVNNQTYLNNSFYTKGLMTESTTKGRAKTDGSGSLVLYRKTSNDYVLRPVDIANATDLNDLSKTEQLLALESYSENGVSIFPFLHTTEQFFYEGGSTYKSTLIETDYDNYGNVDYLKDYGDEAKSDNVEAFIGYSHQDGDCKNNYIVGKPTSMTIYDDDEEVIRKRVGSYYCSNGTGNLKEIRQYAENNEADVAVTTMDVYDSYGNLKQITAPANDGNHDITGNARSLVMKFDYDESATNTYPVRVENVSYGLESTTIYDYKFGKPLCTMDTNGNPLRYRYDSFGRTSRIIGPYEQEQACNSTVDNGQVETPSSFASGPFTIRFSYQPGGTLTKDDAAEISVAKTEHYNRDANDDPLDTIDTWLFSDGMKRVLQTKKTASIDNDNNGAATPDRIVSGRITFDAIGRSIRQYYPILDGNNAATAFNYGYDDHVTEMTYDALDRNKSTKLPDNSTTTIDYGFGGFTGGTLSNYFTTLVTDAKLKQKTTYRDVRELIHGVKEEGGILTRYKYDPLKQIRHVYDAEDNHTEVEYDLLGRRTFINNPDTGNTEYKYDLAGNLIEKITANREDKEGIKYVYDHTRLIDIKYPSFPDNDVHYVYGTSSDKEKNQAGRIKQVKHQSGTELREYGSLGETVREQFTVSAIRNGQVPTYITHYDFDTFGRLMKLTYPSGEQLIHEYDDGGNLSKITGKFQDADYEYLTSLTYDKFEQRVYMELGNGIKTRYTYRDDNRRLEYLNSSGDVAGTFQNNKYTYDKVGNIELLENLVDVPRNSQLGGPTVQNFRYDDLHRLVYADGKFSPDQSRHHFYQLDMVYDNIHNIEQKTQKHTYGRTLETARTQRQTTYDWSYGYDDQSQDDASGPHAPTSIDTRNFHYDANGNQTGWNSTVSGQKRNIVWDDENRIQEINDPGNTAWYAYDDQGQRKVKRGRYGETVYVNQFLTIRDGALATMHVYAGNSRVVSKLKAGKPIGRDSSTTTSTTSAASTGTTSSTTASTVVNSSSSSSNSVSTSSDSNASENSSNRGNSANSASRSGNPGQGRNNRSDTANEHAQDVNMNPTLTGEHPGQGVNNRSDRANEVAQNTVKNPHLIDSGDGDTGGGDIGGDTGGDTTLADIAYDFTGGAEFLYYYHPDHLGSTGYVTDKDGELYEHIEYFPFGETWVLEGTSNWKVPYMYTSKELDEDTQLYYYGARYYDPRTSVWQSADPILGNYLPSSGGKGELAGMGGVFNSFNLGLYSYSHQKPVKLFDPDGNEPANGSEIQLRAPSFFTMTTVAAGRRDMNFDQAVEAGRGFREVTAPVVAATIAAPYVIAGGIVAAPEVTTAVATRSAPLLTRASAMINAASAKVNAAVLSGSIAIQGQINQASIFVADKMTQANAMMLNAGIAMQGQIDKTTTSIGNFINRTGAAAQNMVNRIWTSPLGRNPQLQEQIIDSGAAVIPGTPPPSTGTGQTIFLINEFDQKINNQSNE